MTIFLLTLISFTSLFPFLIVIVKKRKVDPFEPLYFSSAYFILLFVLRPIYDLTIGSEILGSPPFDNATENAFNLALFYSTLSFLAFLMGYYSRWVHNLVNLFPKLPTTWDKNIFQPASYLILVFGLIIHWLLIQSFGGLDAYLSDKQETLTAGGQGYLAIGMFLINFTFASHFTKFLKNGSSKIFICFFLLPLLLLLGLLSGSKGVFINPIVIAIIIWNYVKTRINPIVFLIGIFVLVFIFPIFNLYREIGDFNQLIDAIASFYKSLEVEPLITQFILRFHTFDSFVYTIRDTPSVMDFQYGQTLLPIFTVWIPRQIWEDKPTVSFGKIFAETYYARFFAGTGTSASAGITSEGYINFHIVGALIFAFIFGLLINFLYKYFIRLNFGLPSVAIYACIFLFSAVFWEADIAGFVSARLITLCVFLPLAFVMGKSSKVTNL